MLLTHPPAARVTAPPAPALTKFAQKELGFH
jgi:hypothetical protein